ncbi:MAG: septal ring lytic transglycosylase RlpA family protein [Hymenobacter sp.]
MPSAHKTLPFGTRLRVTNLDNGATVVVRVTDRGPFRHERIIDLAEVAACPLGLVEAGAATVVAEIVPVTTPSVSPTRPPTSASCAKPTPTPKRPSRPTCCPSSPPPTSWPLPPRPM